MFTDSVEISVASGNGGAGAVSFRKEKFIIQGGPDGGDGGDGGDVLVEIVENNDTLSKYRGARVYRAKNGAPGMPKKCAGKRGEDLILKVPPGTQFVEVESGKILLDTAPESLAKMPHATSKDGKILLLKGGKGGLGNHHFKTATNQAPTYAQSGIKGVSLNLKLNLKLIADVGLVGFPNVGKSTLIATLSNARPEIANYEFTTLIPNLGVVNAGDFKSFVMADIPGIIEGASSGRGLGIEFLRHIERTKLLLFVLDATNHRDIKTQFSALRAELAIFSKETNTGLESRPFGIAISKIDALESAILDSTLTDFLALFPLEYEAKNADTIYYEIKESFGDMAWDSATQDSNAKPATQDFVAKDSNATAPLFIIPISSAAHTNTAILPHLLVKYL